MVENRDEELHPQDEKNVQIEDVSNAHLEENPEDSKIQVITSLESGSLEKEDPNTQIKIKKKTWLYKFFKTKWRTTFTIIGLIIVVLGFLCAIPVTRYAMLGLVIKKDISVVIMDSKTNRPVSDAMVSIDSISSRTDANGHVILKSVPVSDSKILVTKKYYTTFTQNYTVPVLSAPKSLILNVVATGRQISITVSNKVTGDPIAGVKIVASGTSTETIADGTAIIILPTQSNTQSATITKDGYNSSTVTVTVNDPKTVNNYTLTPSGSIYFLSNITGTTNVMKTSLDGTSSHIVVAGIGTESKTGTVLLAARDWSYMALLSKRESDGNDRIYVIDDKTNSLKVVDEGASSYQLVGWSGHNFIYIVNRNTTNYWDAKRQAIKSYNAETGNIVVLDEMVGSGSSPWDAQYQQIFNPYILGSQIFYIKSWVYGGKYTYADPKQSISIMTIDNSGNNKKDVKDFPQPSGTYIQANLYEPSGIYIQLSDNSGTNTYYEYEDGTVKPISISTDKFNSPYPTYLFSPSSNSTFWYEVRNSKNTLFVGDKDSKNAKQIATLSDYTPFGWYTDDYIIMSKDSELYITSATKVFSDNNPPVKIGTYQPTNGAYRGYGSGYGGQ